MKDKRKYKRKDKRKDKNKRYKMKSTKWKVKIMKEIHTESLSWFYGLSFLMLDRDSYDSLLLSLWKYKKYK
jgi:hypothetical protein